MKKTITVNLSGIVFHIDEDAYEKLSKYLSTIKSYFVNSEGKDEIMADIENRIAEMFSGKTTDHKQVISISDVDEIIIVMGKPEDFAAESSGSSSGENSSQNTSSTGNRRRRVFRDPDNKLVGGVCSGISAYFDLDPIWMRIAFACALVFFGSGLLLYIILWAVIPEAKTTADKLEMKGEDVNYSNIGKTINEELENLKKKVGDLGKEASSIGSPENKKRAKDFINRLGRFLETVFTGLAKAIIKFIGFILIGTGVVLISVFIASFFGKINFLKFINNEDSVIYSIHEVLEIFVADEHQQIWFVIGLVLLIGVPLISLVYGGIKLLFDIRPKNRTFYVLATALWFSGIVILTYTIYLLSEDFSEDGKKEEKIVLANSALNTLYIETTLNNKYKSKRIHNSKWHWGVKRNEDTVLLYSIPKFNIIKSQNDSFELQIIKISSGETRKEAVDLADKIEYKFTQQDSLLVLEPVFWQGIKQKWRNQKVNLVLKVPVSKTIVLNDGTKEILYDVANVENMSDKQMANHKWKMTEKGLVCEDCE